MIDKEHMHESHDYNKHLIQKIHINGIYQHSKSKKKYKVLAVSCHSEDLSWYVVYETLYINEMSKIWHRPLEMFLQNVVIDGVSVPRFIYIGN